MKKFQKGFTLLELMVVIAIIGILASVAAVSFNSARSKAKDAKIIADAEAVQKAIGLNFIDSEAYPAADVPAGSVPAAPLNNYLAKMGTSGGYKFATKTWEAATAFVNDQTKIDPSCVAGSTKKLRITFQTNGGSAYDCF